MEKRRISKKRKIKKGPEQDVLSETIKEEENGVSTKPQEQEVTPKSIQKQVEEEEKVAKKFGTFTGVFTPTLLTILGVILFLREGWVVGNAGFIGASVIIILSFLITGCTALSISSFVTNTRVGAGGAFSIISQALGIEIGGSIGVPLYLSQSLAVCMYIFGFRAGWIWIFPDHSPLLVDYTVFVSIFLVAMISTAFALRIQFVILAILCAALGSVLIAACTGSMQYPLHLWGDFPGAKETLFTGISFWGVFAIFFPASTGIMAGANMSKELKEPKKSIPLGTLSAVSISFVVYMLMAFWLAKSATVEQLLNDYTVLIDKAFYSPLAISGLLAATFSSALASFIGAPRILEALGSHNILPMSRWFAKRSKRGEPFYATMFTFFISGSVILLRDLNIIAPLITMVFLITYSMINLVVMIENSLQLISFRPYFKIPKIVPFIGFAGTIFVMFIISPIFGLVAVSLITLMYVYLLKRKLKAPYSDVRSGLFEAIAEWSAKKIKLLHGQADRAWKPNFLLPLDTIDRLAGVFRLVHHLAYPVGSVKLLGIQPHEKLRTFEKELENSVASYLKHGVFASFSVMEEESFSKGVVRGIQALRGSFFRPNILFLELPKDARLHKALWSVIDTALYSKMGISMIVYHPEAGLGKEENIHLWIPTPETWELEMKTGNIDLSILLGYRIYDSWHGKLNLFMTVAKEKEEQMAKKYLERLVSLARLPIETTNVIVAKDLVTAISNAPNPDLSIFSLEESIKVPDLWHIRDHAGSTCLFCQDSGNENAFA